MVAAMLTKSFPKRLVEARELRGLTQGQLAHKTKTSQVWSCHVERGRRLPSIPGLLKLVKALNISADFLIGHSINNNGKPKTKGKK